MTPCTLFDFFKFFFFNLGKDATNALITIAGGFLGVLAGSIISRISSREAIAASNKNALDLMRRQEFNKAAAELKNAFLPETIFLKHNANIGGLGNSNRLHEMLRAGYLRQLKALEIFKSYLSTIERITIDHAWDEYCHPKGIPQDPNEKRDFRFNDYLAVEDAKEAEEPKRVALQHIEKILELADFR